MNSIPKPSIIDDRIIFPSELNMFLTPEELLALEEFEYMQHHISEDEYIYYDNNHNIRIGILTPELDNLSPLTPTSVLSPLSDDRYDTVSLPETILSSQDHLMNSIEGSSDSTLTPESTPFENIEQ